MARHCSYCYQRGHNRRSCSKLKQHCTENPDSYTAKHEKNQRANQRTRRCGWCSEEGHNKKTCSKLKIAIATEEGNQRIWNAKLLDALKSYGLGIGSLIKITPAEGSETQWTRQFADSLGGYGIVMKFNEDDMTEYDFGRQPMVVRGATGRIRSIPVPYSIAKDFNHYRRSYAEYNVEIIGKVTNHQTVASFSAAWLQGLVGAKKKLGL